MLGLACPGQWGRSCERDVSGEGPDRAMRSVDSGCGTGGVAAVVMVVQPEIAGAGFSFGGSCVVAWTGNAIGMQRPSLKRACPLGHDVQPCP